MLRLSSWMCEVQLLSLEPTFACPSAGARERLELAESSATAGRIRGQKNSPAKLPGLGSEHVADIACQQITSIISPNGAFFARRSGTVDAHRTG
ncbi:hypothetical protein OKW33_006275 [Paraburkholderia atlantica]